MYLRSELSLFVPHVRRTPSRASLSLSLSFVRFVGGDRVYVYCIPCRSTSMRERVRERSPRSGGTSVIINNARAAVLFRSLCSPLCARPYDFSLITLFRSFAPLGFSSVSLDLAREKRTPTPKQPSHLFPFFFFFSFLFSFFFPFFFFY